MISMFWFHGWMWFSRYKFWKLMIITFTSQLQFIHFNRFPNTQSIQSLKHYPSSSIQWLMNHINQFMPLPFFNQCLYGKPYCKTILELTEKKGAIKVVNKKWIHYVILYSPSFYAKCQQSLSLYLKLDNGYSPSFLLL